MARSGCGTCRDRKVLCDRAVPHCNRCIKAGRRCEGYGTRLSWPRHNDPRRAILGPAPAKKRAATAQSRLRLINTSSWDIELFDLVSTSTDVYGTLLKGLERKNVFQRGQVVTVEASLPLLRTPLSNIALQLSTTEQDLFQYFVYKASYSITAFEHDAVQIQETLTRLALSDTTPSSTAILKSALALASFHRDGNPSETDRLKISALRKLTDSTRGVIGSTESSRGLLTAIEPMCHVAAAMILCTLECYQTSAQSSHWLWYVCGSKSIIKASGLDEMPQDKDLMILLGWVHYCDVVTRFSLRHWQPNLSSMDPRHISGVNFVPFHPKVCENGLPENLASPPHKILHLLSNVFDGVVELTDKTRDTEDYVGYLKMLDWKLRRIDALSLSKGVVTANANLGTVIELYRLASLIYLRRASGGILPTDEKFRGWIDHAFELLAQLPSCQWPFPVLIFGCEADTDEQRMIILDLITRTQSNIRVPNLRTVERAIQIIWVQGDLLNEELDYVRKLGLILSTTHSAVPAFI